MNRTTYLRALIVAALLLAITPLASPAAQAQAWQARQTPSNQYQATFDTFTKQGYRLKTIAGYVDGGTELYASLWIQASGPEWQAQHGLSSADYQKAFEDLLKQGFRLTWVAGHEFGGQAPDITYITIAVGFVYLAAILDAWSRRVVGYAIGRRIDARLALAALRAAIASRQPPIGCIHHSDRGSQYAAEDLSQGARSERAEGLDGPARQPLRQRQGRELHEDLESRGGVPDGVRHLRGRGGLIAALHRRGLQ
jgi:DNA-binding transcriptional regulator of glucitol operon